MTGFSEYYFNQGLTTTNVPTFDNPLNKIYLTKNNVSLQFYFATANQLGYKLSFIVKIMLPQYASGFQKYNIDEISLRNAILENVDDFDKKYIVLKKFSTNNAEFYFDYMKWIKESFKNVKLEKQFSFFDRSIKLGVGVPKVILFDVVRNGFVKFITQKIKEYCVKNGLSKTWFGKIVPQTIQNSFDIKPENIFDYDYDIQFNKLNITLRPEYVIAVSYLITNSINKKEKIDVAIKDPKYFELSVNKNLRKYTKDWKKLIKTKLI